MTMGDVLNRVSSSIRPSPVPTLCWLLHGKNQGSAIKGGIVPGTTSDSAIAAVDAMRINELPQQIDG